LADLSKKEGNSSKMYRNAQNALLKYKIDVLASFIFASTGLPLFLEWFKFIFQVSLSRIT
jgi:hypothetical protein